MGSLTAIHGRTFIDLMGNCRLGPILGFMQRTGMHGRSDAAGQDPDSMKFAAALSAPFGAQVRAYGLDIQRRHHTIRL
jgi:hypothetical protein